MKFSRLRTAYIKMVMSQYQKDWKREVYLTLKFVKLFDQTAEKTQMEFLSYLYNSRIYIKGNLLLLDETQILEEINVNPQNISILSSTYQKEV